jgi:hypothetical protein
MNAASPFVYHSIMRKDKVHMCIKQYLNFNISVMEVDENIKDL